MALVVTGQFKDANVAGLSFSSGDEQGITDETASFTCEENTDVRITSYNVCYTKLLRKRALGEGSLQSPQAFYQGNAAGPIVWVDPAYELVGVYFSTALRLIEDEWPGDLFMNAVTAAVSYNFV